MPGQQLQTTAFVLARELAGADAYERLTVFSDLSMFATDPTDTAPGSGQPTRSPDGVEITVLPAPHGVVALSVGVVTPRGVASQPGRVSTGLIQR